MNRTTLLTLAVTVAMVGCSNLMKPEDTTTSTPTSVSSTEFYVTSKVTNNGTPVKGATVRLVKSGLTAITGEDGSYTIKGKVGTNGLAKVSADGYNDTLVVTVANPSKPNDSSEVVKTPVTSGVIMDLPETFIVQREIRGYLSGEDEANVSRIEASVYDEAYPDQVKTIDLWHDITNRAFSSFAYFSSEKNKSYSIYIKIYDNQNQFIGRSTNLTFPDNAGNIIFRDAFKITNAKPHLTIENQSVVGCNKKVAIHITAVDSFGGNITKCEIALNQKDYTEITAFKALAKRASGFGTTINDSIIITTPLKDTTYTATVRATDNDNNITIDTFKLQVKVPTTTLGVATLAADGSPYNWPKLNDDMALKFTGFKSTDSTLTLTKIEYRLWDSTNAWMPATTDLYKVNISGKGTEYDASKNTHMIAGTYDLNEKPFWCRITLSNGLTVIREMNVTIVYNNR